MRRSLLSLCLLLACGDGEPPPTTGPMTEPDLTTSGQPTGECLPKLELTNSSSFTLTQIDYVVCADQAGQTSPLVPNAVEPGQTRTIDLPAPDCYYLQIREASGCELENRVQTDPLSECEIFKITVSDDLFVCPGG